MPRVQLSSTARLWSIVPLSLLLLIGVVTLAMYNPIRPWLAWLGGIAAVIAILIGNPWVTYEDGPPTKTTTFMRVNSGVGLATLGIIGTASFAGFIGKGTPPPATPITDPLTQAADLIRYANTLVFDAEYHHMDEDLLEVQQGSQIDSLHGPRARVYPERSSHLNSWDDLARGAGRIVAKIEVDPDVRRGNIGHAKLRLPVGVSYLWIDNVTKDDSTIRAIIVSANGAVQVLGATHHGRHATSYAYAQFKFDPTDPCICESCMFHGWCRVCGS